MWDRIEPVRPERGLPRVPSVRRLSRDERRDGEERRDDRPAKKDPPPEDEPGHVDVRA